jgi:hypothetical protein
MVAPPGKDVRPSSWNRYAMRLSSHRSSYNSRFARISLQQKNYVNDKITDNVWNTVWFWQAEVSTKPAPFPSRRMPKPVPGPPRPGPGPDPGPIEPHIRWDDVLDEYLRYIRGRSGRIHAEEEDDEDDDDAECVAEV